MLADNTPSTTQAHGGSPADAPAFGRGLAVGMMDRRTREWRRRLELVKVFTEALGGADKLSPVTIAKVEIAAELAVAAELTRARFLGGEAISPDDLVRTSNQAARAERALGIGARQTPAKPDLRTYLAGKAA
jgi:hypothetical protein